MDICFYPRAAARLKMLIVIIVIVCVALMGLFIGVTIAGGRAHDRQNAERESQILEYERRRRDEDSRPD